MFSMAMWMAALVAPIQIVAGDQHGLNTLEYQPAKIAAMEGHFDSHPDGAPLILFGWPTMKPARRRYALEIPKARQPDPHAFARCGAIKGLEGVPRENWPNVALVVLDLPHHGRRSAC